MRTPRRLAVFMLPLLAVIWGYSWVPGKLGVENSSAFVFAALRTFPAGVVLLLILALLRRPLWPKPALFIAAIGVLQNTAFVGLISAALVTGGAGHTAMLANTWQFWLLVLAWVFLGEPLRGHQWLAVGIGLVGLVLIIEPWKIHGVLSSLLTLGGALSFAFGAVLTKVMRRRHQVDLLSFTTWQTLFGALPLAAVAFLLPGQNVTWHRSLIWTVAYSALIGTALGSLLWLYILSSLPANLAGLGTIGTPVVGVLVSYVQLHEQLTAYEIAGMVLVVAALALLAHAGFRRAPEPSPGAEPATAGGTVTLEQPRPGPH